MGPLRIVRPIWEHLRFSITAGALGLAISAGLGAPSHPPAKLTIEDRGLDPAVRSRTSVAPVARKVGPSVVNIYSSMTVRERGNPMFQDPFFRRFFGDDSGEGPRLRKSESLGSGVIVSADGYLLTANHVIEGADKIKVALASGEKEFDAKVIGTDPPTDIAVLKIEARTQLPAITIGDSEKLEVGDMVLAIGNPFAIGQTVTMGIVSGLSRGGFDINSYENFIQTDAAINPGNSGGALVDAEGRLVGINTVILSRSGGFQGVGLAVPVNMARYVMNRLIESGKVARGYLGINIQPLTRDLAREFSLPDESSGVLVGDVTPNSAAAKAGLKSGDVITEVSGKKVTDPRSLQLLIAQTPPESRINLRVLRGEPGRKPVEKTVSATLAELPQKASAGRGESGPSRSGQTTIDALDGVAVTDIDSGARQQFNIPRSIAGALVVSVEPGSRAAEAGLRHGDVITEINRQAVRNSDDAVALSEKGKGNRVLLRAWSRGVGGPGAARYVVIEPSRN